MIECVCKSLINVSDKAKETARLTSFQPRTREFGFPIRGGLLDEAFYGQNILPLMQEILNEQEE